MATVEESLTFEPLITGRPPTGLHRFLVARHAGDPAAHPAEVHLESALSPSDGDTGG